MERLGDRFSSALLAGSDAIAGSRAENFLTELCLCGLRGDESCDNSLDDKTDPEPRLFGFVGAKSLDD